MNMQNAWLNFHISHSHRIFYSKINETFNESATNSSLNVLKRNCADFPLIMIVIRLVQFETYSLICSASHGRSMRFLFSFLATFPGTVKYISLFLLNYLQIMPINRKRRVNKHVESSYARYWHVFKCAWDLFLANFRFCRFVLFFFVFIWGWLLYVLWATIIEQQTVEEPHILNNVYDGTPIIIFSVIDWLLFNNNKNLSVCLIFGLRHMYIACSIIILLPATKMLFSKRLVCLKIPHISRLIDFDHYRCLKTTRASNVSIKML